MIEKYGHGGDLLTATQVFGREADQWLDFSSNMNPWGPPKQVQEIIYRAMGDLIHYPDPASRELKQQIAHTYDVPVDSITIGNGAAELIDLAVRVDKIPRAALVEPCFSEYAEALQKTGSKIVPLQLQASDHFNVRAAKLAPILERTDGIILGHPNNPTGRLLDSDVLELLRESGKRIILDEAFIDFIPDEENHSQLQRAAGSRNLAVIRSMTKFYSIPGIRLGFMVAHPDRIREVEALRVPWSVNVFAQRVGESLLQDEAFKKRTLDWLRAENPWLSEQLASLGFTVFPSVVNYLLVRLPDGWTAQAMQREMGQRGILIRNAARFPGLNERYVRLAVKTRADHLRLLDTFKQVLR